jgi:capsular polysaccharide biosynthesis protein
MGAWKELFARVWPEVLLICVSADDSESETHARLCVAAPADLVVQAADTSAVTQVRLFRLTFMHLREGGTYLTPRLVPVSAEEIEAAAAEHALKMALHEHHWLEEPVSDLWDLVSKAQAARTRDFKEPDGGDSPEDVRGLGRHLAQVHVSSKMLRLRSGFRAQAKLTEAEADAVLVSRPDIGREITSLPATGLTARAAYRHNLEFDPHFNPEMTVPKLTLREYNNPVCARGQVVMNEHLLLPETFRHHMSPRMVNIYVEEAAPRFGYLRRDVSDADPLPGAWFHLDSEWPGHFGHTLTECLGRMWGWERARQEHPDIKCLMTLQHDREPMELAPFELDLLGVFGIGADDVHIFDGSCRPEKLYAATSMFSLPDYVHPEILEIWRRVGDHLASQAPARERPRRLFCTRPPDLKRSCRNGAEVEALFEEYGFEVVSPERFPLSEQVAMFRSAEAIGGFAGSALFTSALCPSPTKLFTVAPTSYGARNEQLIAAALGHEIVSAWSRPDVDHPPGTWTTEAFGSNFLFDFDDEGVFLRDHLARLGPLS